MYKEELYEGIIKEMCKEAGISLEDFFSSDDIKQVLNWDARGKKDAASMFTEMFKRLIIQKHESNIDTKSRLLNDYFISAYEYLEEIKNRVDMMDDISKECERKLYVINRKSEI